MKIGLFNAVLVLSAASLGGCNTQPYCDALSKCGGDFLATATDLGSGSLSAEWVAEAANKDACIDQVPNPPDPPQLSLIPPRPSGVRAVEPSTIDWCGGLVLMGDGTISALDDGWYETLKRFNGWFPSVPLYTAQVELMQANQYELTTTQLVSQRLELSPTCLVAQGVVLSCTAIGDQLQAFVSKRLSGIAGLKATVYSNACKQTDEGGCSCGYNVSLTTTTKGPWASNDKGELTFFDELAAPPSQTDFCSNPGSLQLSGAKETDLFNRNSLKTLKLHPPSCTDHVQSKTLGETGLNEAGIGCGGQCPPCK
jgi:hypothetical protein